MGGREAQRYRTARSVPAKEKLNAAHLSGSQSINIGLNIPIQIGFF